MYAPPPPPQPVYPTDTSPDRVPVVSKQLRAFVVTFQSNPAGDFWPLSTGRTTVGRANAPEPADIALADATISSRHAAFNIDLSTVVVEDTNSTNGTYVNEEHIGQNGKRELRDGDRVRFGGYTTHREDPRTARMKSTDASVARLAALARSRSSVARGRARRRTSCGSIRRAGVANGTPILTTVIEVVQFNRLSDALTPCAAITGYDQTLDCWSKAIEKPGALWSPFPFPEANAHFFVNVAGADTLTKFDSKEQWGTVVGKEAGVGTAWLIALDASSGMGARYADARVVAEEFIKAMQPNDLMDLDDLRRSPAPVRRRLEVEDVRAAQRSHRRLESDQVADAEPRERPPAVLADPADDAGLVRRPREHQGAADDPAPPGDGRPQRRLGPR